jgi:hypothetical protein
LFKKYIKEKLKVNHPNLQQSDLTTAGNLLEEYGKLKGAFKIEENDNEEKIIYQTMLQTHLDISDIYSNISFIFEKNNEAGASRFIIM